MRISRTFAARIAAVVTVLTGLVTFLAPGVASAHAFLVFSTPAASAVLPVAPDLLQLDFNEDVELSLSSLRLFDGDQRPVDIGTTEHTPNNKSVIQAELPRLENGTYVVVWRVTSADGHPVTGAFPFEIGTVSSGTADSLVQSVVQRVQQKSPLGAPLSAMRFVAFLGLLLLLGVMVLSWGTQLLDSARVLLAGLGGVVLLLAGSLAVFVLQGSWVTGGGWGDVMKVNALGDVATSRLGIAIIARVVLAILWLLVLQLLRREAWTSVSGVLFGVLGMLTAATFAFSGHPSAESSAWLWAPVDLLHLGAVGAWAGGLLVLAIAGREIASGAHGPVVPARYSRIATFAMPAAVLTGLAQGWHLLGGFGTVGDTNYSWTLVAKASVVAVAVLVGVRARRTLAADGGFSARFGDVIRFEAVLMVVVLGLTAGMVASSPKAGFSKIETFNVTMAEKNIIAEISVQPPRTGTVEIHTVFSPPGGAIEAVKDVKVRMTLPSRNLPAMPVQMLSIGANHWSGVVQVPYAGEWDLEVLLTPHEGQLVRYATKVTVKD